MWNCLLKRSSRVSNKPVNKDKINFSSASKRREVKVVKF